MTLIKLEYQKPNEDDLIQRSQSFYNKMQTRRSVRQFSEEEVPIEVVENIVKTAATAPSGANKQPWKFVVVSNKDIKKQIRVAAEKEEKEFYENRAPQTWLEDLKVFETDWYKEFLEDAPYLIVVFKELYSDEKEERSKHYYVNESVGIATGMLITAVHNAGLVTLTHTPSPMGFLGEILNRPNNEKPFLLLPVGYPADNFQVPDIKRKDTKDILVHI
jgi:nitroreductase